MCPDGRKSKKVACDPGQGLFSFSGSTHCFYCPIGKACTLASTDTGFIKAGEPIITKCDPGSTSDEGAVTCTPCPAG